MSAARWRFDNPATDLSLKNAFHLYEYGKFLLLVNLKIREILMQNLIPHPRNTLKLYLFLLANLPKK